MSDHHTATGTIWAVFGHRFAIDGTEGRVLADLGPAGRAGLSLTPGDTVTVSGERKPSEIKVSRLTLGNGPTRTIAWPSKSDRPGSDHNGPGHAPADPEAALAAARAAGYAPTGEARRKAKHFEIPATKGAAAFTLHVDRDGAVRKAEPVRIAPSEAA